MFSVTLLRIKLSSSDTSFSRPISLKYQMLISHDYNIKTKSKKAYKLIKRVNGEKMREKVEVILKEKVKPVRSVTGL